jgi:hypothetical protein
MHTAYLLKRAVKVDGQLHVGCLLHILDGILFCTPNIVQVLLAQLHLQQQQQQQQQQPQQRQRCCQMSCSLRGIASVSFLDAPDPQHSWTVSRSLSTESELPSICNTAPPSPGGEITPPQWCVPTYLDSVQVPHRVHTVINVHHFVIVKSAHLQSHTAAPHVRNLHAVLLPESSAPRALC